jgi:tetratricopeptide (TPR) repeat protein
MVLNAISIPKVRHSSCAGQRIFSVSRRPSAAVTDAAAKTLMNTIFITTVLCFFLFSGCTKSQEKKSASVFPRSQQSGDAEQAKIPNYAGLIEEYRTILAEDPDNLAALIAVGNAYFDSGAWQNAITAYERALQIAPRNVDVRTDMGTSYRNLGHYDRALTEYRLALEYDPSYLNARFNMGVVYANDKKDYQAAIRVWGEILKLAPNYPQAELLRSNIAKLKKGANKEVR